VALDSNGEALYLETAGNLLVRLPLDLEELARVAKATVGRGLTIDECRQYVGDCDGGRPGRFVAQWLNARDRFDESH
jgi:hypothetical protein